MERHVVTEGSAFYEIDDACMREKRQKQERNKTKTRPGAAEKEEYRKEEYGKESEQMRIKY